MEKGKQKRGAFDDMEDDIPFDSSEPPKQHWIDHGEGHVKRNHNLNRKYKPQKGRMRLMFCSHCTFKFRTSQLCIGMMKRYGCPACEAGTMEQGD